MRRVFITGASAGIGEALARAIESKRRLAVIPWQMAIVATLLRAMPGWLYDRLAARAPRKPRDVQI